MICNEEKYLIRCLNSLKRQIVKPCEIIVVSSYELKEDYYDETIKISIESSENIYNSLNLGLKRAIGEYMFICDSDSNITENTLKDLLFNAENNEKIVPSADIYYPDKDGFRLSNPFLSVCGKLLCTDLIRSESMEFSTDSSVGEFLFFNQYLDKTEGIKCCTGAGLYKSKTEMPLIFGETIYQYEENREWVSIFDNNLPNNHEYYKSRVFIQTNDEKLRIVCLQNIWPEPNEDYIKSLVKKQTENRLVEERKKLKPIEKKETIYQKVDLSGYEFASQMPARALRGEIGLKSIIKCFGAWMKSKVKRGKNDETI